MSIQPLLVEWAYRFNPALEQGRTISMNPVRRSQETHVPSLFGFLATTRPARASPAISEFPFPDIFQLSRLHIHLLRSPRFVAVHPHHIQFLHRMPEMFG